MRLPFRRRTFACLCTLLAAGSAAPVPAQPDEQVHGNWTVRCEQVDSDAAPECIMDQNLVLRAGGQPVLQFAIGLAPDDAIPTVLLKLPLGIYLPPGVSFRIDDGAAATFPVERCDPDGCQAVMKLRESTVTQLRAGHKLEIGFHDGARAPLSMSLSLEGFGPAIDALRAGSVAGDE
ncbi:MAG: invasion associated locus B family protein [Gammaproteobacteria bacterium]